MSAAVRFSTTPSSRILIAEQEAKLRDYLQVALRRSDVAIEFAENGQEVLDNLARNAISPALVILDVVLPHEDGVTTLKEIRRFDSHLPVIILSGPSATVNVVEAMQNGASNFLEKPLSYETLRRAVDQYLPNGNTNETVLQSEMMNATTGAWGRKLEPLLARIAGSEAPLLVVGETGSGKEVVARRIHCQSSRADQVFLKLNCAALPSELVESELFGYERGAFTGAFKSNPGKFELANRGTIFLDEIGDMDLTLQAKLLQVLQDQEFLRLGAKEATQVDVRVIAATHRNLEERVAEGAFRQDLYYRLRVLNVTIPPLRERRDEIIPLACWFLRKHNPSGGQIPQLSPELKAALLDHRWPGNIRELENAMRSFLVLEDADTVISDLRRVASQAIGRDFQRIAPQSQKSHSSDPAVLSASPADGITMHSLENERATETHRSMSTGATQLARVDEARKKAEKELILHALDSALWNRKRAAAVLGIDYRALLYKMKKLAIAQPPNDEVALSESLDSRRPELTVIGKRSNCG